MSPADDALISRKEGSDGLATEETLVQGPALTADEEDEEWLEAPPPAARRRWLSPLTLALVLALVATGAFILGVEIEKGQKSGQAGGPTAAGGGFAAALGSRKGAAARGGASFGEA